MNHKILIVSVLIVMTNCSDKNNPVNSASLLYKEFAHGIWEASLGDTLFYDEETDLMNYGWYAIDTKSHPDSVYITWDNGRACTRKSAIMQSTKIKFTFSGPWLATFVIMDDNTAFATFTSGDKQYIQGLTKTSVELNYFCY